MKTIENTVTTGLTLLFASILLINNASASLLGTTISGCNNTSYGGSVTTDTSICLESFADAEVIDPGYEFTTALYNRTVDFTGDTVSIIYPEIPLSGSPDLFIFSNLNWGGQPGIITGLQLLTLNALNVTTAFTENSIGLLVNDPLNAATVTFSILTSHSAIPVPAAVWLFGTALIGLVGVSKRNKAA